MANNKPIFELIGLALDAVFERQLCPQVTNGREIPIETIQVSYDEEIHVWFISIETFLPCDYDVAITKSGDVAAIQDRPKIRIRLLGEKE